MEKLFCTSSPLRRAAVAPDTLDLAAVVHHRQRPDLARIGVFFTTRTWQGEPRNAEPHKCGRLVWADPRLLPRNTIDYPAQGIRTWLAGTGYTPHHWPSSVGGRLIDLEERKKRPVS